MRKKISLFIFSILLVFLFFNNVSAKVYEFTCKYKNSELPDRYKEVLNITYHLDGNILVPVSCERHGLTPVAGSIVNGRSCNEYKIENLPKNISLSFQTICPKSIDVDEENKIIEIVTQGLFNLESESERVELKDRSSTCLSYTNSDDCRGSDEVACLWNETKYGNYCNVDDLLYVRCGDAKDIPYMVPGLISFGVNFLKILTPIILIAMSVISLLKALANSNEDVIKKAQKGLIRKIIASVMVFMVVTIVQFVIMKVADSEIESDVNGKVETSNMSDCLNCLLNNDCKETVYYKTYIGSELIETPVTQIPR